MRKSDERRIPMSDRTRSAVAAQAYEAYALGNREMLEEVIAEDYEFWSPQDEGLDRETYFRVCWPNHEHLAAFEFARMVEHEDEVIVTYEAARTDGTKFRNTEVLTIRDGQMVKTEVYFGWNLA
jgi:ketosteroid isomerase-like protein